MKSREIVFAIRPECEGEFSAAFAKWAAAEPLLCGTSIFGSQVKAFLHPVRVLTGDKAGTWHNDRPRAVDVVRKFIPETCVISATVDGKDWRA